MYRKGLERDLGCGKRKWQAWRWRTASRPGDRGGLVGSCCPLVFTPIVFQRIQNYYGLAIRRNFGSVDAMVAAIKAIIFHSTDPYSDKYEKKAESFLTNVHDTRRRQAEGRHDHSICPKTEAERHQFCPEGPNSWCKWQADAENMTSSYDPKKSVLPHSFFLSLGSIFDSLADKKLLSRCERGNTQNAVNIY